MAAGNLKESQRWLNKAGTSLIAAESLMAEGLFHDAISRAYFAMFYAAKALLIRDGFETSKHSAVIATFGREYSRTGRIDSRYHRLLIEGFKRRQKADYDVYWMIDHDTAKAYLTEARSFVRAVESLFE
jgi:uncharacterized protein (UPF0332 family)